MFELCKEFPENLILGMEIRDVVANFVASKANSIRNNSKFKECMNVGVVKTNTMKTIHNYFKKESVSTKNSNQSLCVGRQALLLFRGSPLQEAEPPPKNSEHHSVE
jgi:hypothetical protein